MEERLDEPGFEDLLEEVRVLIERLRQSLPTEVAHAQVKATFQGAFNPRTIDPSCSRVGQSLPLSA